MTGVNPGSTSARMILQSVEPILETEVRLLAVHFKRPSKIARPLDLLFTLTVQCSTSIAIVMGAGSQEANNSLQSSSSSWMPLFACGRSIQMVLYIPFPVAEK